MEERGKISGKTEDEGVGVQTKPVQLDVSQYCLFVGSIISPETKKKYLQRMGYFFDYLNISQEDEEERFEILTRSKGQGRYWLCSSSLVMYFCSIMFSGKLVLLLDHGVDCDFVIKGETTQEFLKNGADHAIQKHGMRAEDIYLNHIPANLLCHSFNEEH